MKTLRSSLLLLCSLAMLSYAEVVPWLIVTGRGTANLPGADSQYLVPEGKVFIIEAVQHVTGTGGSVTEGQPYRVQTFQRPSNYPSRRTIFIDVGTFEKNKMNPLPRPLHLKAGDGVGSNQSSGHTYWWGKLVDTGDLFATLDVELDKSESRRQCLVSPPLPLER